MKLRYVELKAFRQHAETHVEFPETGVVGIVGANESGKSTILEAVAFALFGTAATRGTKSGLRWNRAPARHTAGVELAFEVGGKAYIIQRGESNARLVEDGTPGHTIADGISAVDEYVPRLLGMSLDEYEATYLCRQKDLDRLADMGGVERRQFFLRVLGVQRIATALRDCRTRKNELGREVQGLETGLGDAEPIERELQEANAELHAAERELVEATTELSRAENDAKSARDAFHALAQLKERHDALKMSHTQAVRQQEQANAEEARIKAQIADLGDVVGVDKDLIDRTERRLEATRSAIEKEIETRNQRIRKAGEDCTAHRTRLGDVKRRIIELKRLGDRGDCPTCGQPVGQHVSRVLDELHDQHRSLEASLREADRTVARATKRSGRETELRAEADQLRTQLQHLHAIESKTERLRALTDERTRWLEKLFAARTVVADARAAITELGFNAEQFAAARRKLEKAQRAEGDARERHGKAEAGLRSARSRVERAEAALASYDERAAKLGAVRAELSTHTRTADRLAEFRAEVAAGIVPDLEQLASGFLQLLTDGRHEGVELSDDFAPTLLESGLEIEVPSGGTEDLIALAMRLAISQLIAERAGHPLSLLILDEPFGSLDAVRRENVLSLIRRLRSVFQQVILITHVEEAKDAVDTAIVVEFDETEGRSSVRMFDGLEEVAA